MDALQRSGLEAHDISLHGDAIEAAESRPRERERAGMRHVALRVLAGAALGTVLGALLGALAGTAIYGLPGGGVPDGFAALTIGGALAVGAVAGIGAGVMSLDLTERRELTFGQTQGRVIVAVRSADPDRIARARETLASHGGTDLRTGEMQRRATG